jgi:hypothetical protein
MTLHLRQRTPEIPRPLTVDGGVIADLTTRQAIRNSNDAVNWAVARIVELTKTAKVGSGNGSAAPAAETDVPIATASTASTDKAAKMAGGSMELIGIRDHLGGDVAGAVPLFVVDGFFIPQILTIGVQQAGASATEIKVSVGTNAPDYNNLVLPIILANVLTDRDAWVMSFMAKVLRFRPKDQLWINILTASADALALVVRLDGVRDRR